MSYSSYGENMEAQRLKEQEAIKKRNNLIFKIGKWIGGFILALVVWGIQPYTYENVDAGNVGIKLNLYGTDRGVDRVTIVTGRVWYNTYTTKIIEFPTFVQNVDYQPFAINTVDAARFDIDTKMQYRVVSDSVPKIYTTFRVPLTELQGEGKYIQTAVYDAFKAIVPKYTSDSLMSKRAQFESEAEIVLKQKLASKGIILEELTSNITPPKSMAEAIEAKNSSIQARLAAENQAKQAIAEASVVKAKAEGEAAATLVRARAEAEANRLRQQTLTPLLIQQQWIQAWKAGGSQVPSYVTGSGQNMIFNMPTK